jgi:uncharacterized protein (UPF0333 family)
MAKKKLTVGIIALAFIICGLFVAPSSSYAAWDWYEAKVARAGNVNSTWFYVIVNDADGNAFSGGADLIKLVDQSDKTTIAVILTAIASGKNIYAAFDDAAPGQISNVMILNQ